ncbi:MAG: choloylglycine hydrolase [Clostridia bacterium]|nr:choloylglycine hydrolase [Clostridia bacterium]
MCTAISYKTSDHYFGRNLDWEFSFGEKITITPRNFKLRFKNQPDVKNHYAIIGMALTENNYPLYFDATNEHGLSIAGLNFPSNAVYNPYRDDKINIAPYEFISWVLCQCKTTKEATKLIKNINFFDPPFSDSIPLSPLHWIVSDKNTSITVEPVSDGTKIIENPVGILTNNPPFEMQLHNLNNYMNLSNEDPKNSFSDKLNLSAYSRGMGGLGLPGDLSSQSRFVKAAFTKFNVVSDSSEQQSVSTFFHILSSVEQQKGCVKTKEGNFEYTIYSSCCNTDKGIYYSKTYYGDGISKTDMHSKDLNSSELIFQ